MKWMLKIVIGVNHIRYVSDDIKELENIVLMYEAGEAFNYNDDRIAMQLPSPEIPKAEYADIAKEKLKELRLTLTKPVKGGIIALIAAMH